MKISGDAAQPPGFGGDTGDRSVQYGSAIGSNDFTGAGTVAPVELNLDFNLADAFAFDVSNIGTGSSVSIILFAGGTTFSGPGISITGTGTYSMNLGEFPGLTEAAANDVDGFFFNFLSGRVTASEGLTVSQLRFETAPVPEPRSPLLLIGSAVVSLRCRRRQG